MDEKRKTIPTVTVSLPPSSAFEAAYYVEDDGTVQPPKRYAPHIHDTIEFYFLLEGEAAFSVENKVYALAPGDAVLSRPNELHHCIHDTAARHAHACVWFAPGDGFLFDAFLKTERHRLSLDPQGKAELFRTLDKLVVAAQKHDKQSQYAYLIYLLNLLRPATEVATDEADDRPLPTALASVLTDVALNFREITSVETLAAKHFVSRSTLERLFGKHLHVTPKAYVESKRLAYARKLLRGGASVYSAAIEAGFTDCSGFIRLFKARFGVTPAAYKRESTLDFLHYDRVVDDENNGEN